MINHRKDGGWELTTEAAVNVHLEWEKEELTFDAGGDRFCFAFASEFATQFSMEDDSRLRAGSTTALHITAEPSGMVTIKLDGQSLLSVSPAPALEAWELTAINAGFLAVCVVGGGTAWFQ